MGTGIYISMLEGSGGVLWRYDLSTTTITRVTDPSIRIQFVYNPEVSVDVRQDEQRIAYVTALPGREELWVSDIDGSNPLMILSSTHGLIAPRWRGRDGSSIVYLSNQGGQRDVWQVHVITRTTAPLTSGPLREERVEVSADGSVLVVDTASEESHIWALDPRGREPRQLTNDSLSDYYASVATDSVGLIFHRNRGERRLGFVHHDTRIYSSTLNSLTTGGSSVPVADGFGGTISPDGSRVAFFQYSEEAPEHLWVSDTVPGRRPFRVATDVWVPPFSPVHWDWRWKAMTWSRDGSTIFYTTNREPRVTQIVATELGADTPLRTRVIARSANRSLGREQTGFGDLHLSPDGRALAYIEGFRFSGQGGEVRSHDLTTGLERVLFEAPRGTNVFLKGWTTRGSLIVLKTVPDTRDRREVEVFEVHPDTGSELIGIMEGVRGGNSHFDAPRDLLYVAATERDRRNIAAFDLRERRLRTITQNTFPGVSFFGFQAMANGVLVYTKHENSRDVWLVVSH